MMTSPTSTGIYVTIWGTWESWSHAVCPVQTTSTSSSRGAKHNALLFRLFRLLRFGHRPVPVGPQLSYICYLEIPIGQPCGKNLEKFQKLGKLAIALRTSKSAGKTRKVSKNVLKIKQLKLENTQFPKFSLFSWNFWSLKVLWGWKKSPCLKTNARFLKTNTFEKNKQL